VPDETLAYVKDRQERQTLDVLIVDGQCWSREEHRPKVHFDLQEAMALAKLLRPKRTVVVGIGHQLEHTETNEKLRKIMGQEHAFELAFDGMVLNVDI
jgi:phosphoribosyl 1,2-cyclic phosphodiesterase